MKKFLLFGLFLLAPLANATLINSYDFNGDLSDTLGNGNDLVSSGGSVSSGRYFFSNNQGLRLTSALPSTTEYGIEIKFKISDTLLGYNKIIDFQDLASDIGLYALNSNIKFYTASPSVGSILLDTDFTLGFTRSAAGIIEGFINNVSIFSVADSNQAVSAANILNFFEDDFHTGQGESFTGSVDFIRIHNNSSTFGNAPTIPEPTTVLLLGSGLIGFMGMRKKSSKK